MAPQAIACFTSVLLLSTCAEAPEPGTVLDSYARARATLDAAIEAHGGLEALRQARQVHVTLEGTDHWRNQSRQVASPYDTEPQRIDLYVDLKNGRIVREQWSAYPGGIVRGSRFVEDSGRNVGMNLRTRIYRGPQPSGAADRSRELLLLPQFILLRAHDNPWNLRALGQVRLGSGDVVDAIAHGSDLAPVTLLFDRETRLLRATVSPDADILRGDAANETEFTGYRELGGIVLPTRRTVRFNDELILEQTYRAAVSNYTMPDSLVQIPDGIVLDPLTGTPPEPVRELARGVWAVGGWSYSLVVEFSDHLLVFDTPGGADVAARMKELSPEKPIRYAVPSHHHDDHAAAVKTYASGGAVIVTTPENEEYMRTLARSRPSFGDASSIPPLVAEPVIEIINGKRVFTDGSRTVEVHNIGPNPHAKEMLVAWLPAEGIVFHGDLVDMSAGGVVRPGSNNETTVHFGEWLARQGWQVRTIAGTHGILNSPADFQEILRQAPYTR